MVQKRQEMVEFSSKKKQTKNNMVLEHWILHIYHFKTHLFFQFLGGGTLLSLDLGPKGVSNL